MPTTCALVLDHGHIAADGCGFLLQIGEGADAELVHPTNLPTEFQEDGVELWVDFVAVEEQFSCGLLPAFYNQVELQLITEKTQDE